MKIQAAFRRSKDRRQLERQGLTTSSMRNSIRQRQAQLPQCVLTDDVPIFFRFCGVGLLL